MKKRACLLLLLMIPFCVFSLTVNYNFDIIGKTNQKALMEKISMPETEEFDSIESALVAADSYKQQMINMRLFTSSEYTSEYDESNNSISVTYHIVDSKTLLLLPYPKYDSNSGLHIKIKGIEKNFAGIFGEFDAALEYHKNQTCSTGALIVNANGVKLGQGTYSGHLDTNVNLASLGSTYTNLSLSSSLPFDQFVLTPSFAVNNLHFNSLEGSSFVFGVGASGFSYKGVNLSVSESLSVNSGAEINSAYISCLTTGMSGSKGKISVSDTFSYYPKKSYNLITNSFNLGYSLNGNISLGSCLFSNTSLTDKNANYIQLSGSSSYNNYFGGVYHSFSVSDNEVLYSTTKKSANYITATSSVGAGSINYTQKDFRYGFTYSVSTDMRKIIYNELDGYFNYSRARAEMTWFPFNNSTFNPSFRLFASISSVPFSSFCGTSGFGVNYNDTTALLPYYMRGIRDDNDVSSMTVSKAFMLINMNLTFKFISLGNFADTYATGFCDFAVMADGEKGAKNLTTVGFEGICVLRQYPVYPIRASLGVNLESLCKWHDTREGKPEYELYFGLYHFF